MGDRGALGRNWFPQVVCQVLDASLGMVASSSLAAKSQEAVACYPELPTLPLPPHRGPSAAGPTRHREPALCPGWLSWRPGPWVMPTGAETASEGPLPGLTPSPSTGSLTPLQISPRRLSRFQAGIWPLVGFHHIPQLVAFPLGFYLPEMFAKPGFLLPWCLRLPE